MVYHDIAVPQGIGFYHGIPCCYHDILWYVLRYYGKISAHHGTTIVPVYTMVYHGSTMVLFEQGSNHFLFCIAYLHHSPTGKSY